MCLVVSFQSFVYLTMSGELLFCYNRGCGQKFDPDKNSEESCRYHSGHPVFHDAYKGWSCCKKKCTDFTEFLNIKGCTLSYHSNVKPPEPEKPAVDKSTANEIIEVQIKEKVIPEIKRPPFDTPLVRLKPEVSTSLKESLAAMKISGDGDNGKVNVEDPENIPLGTACKNNSCKEVYAGIDSLNTLCTHHPGYPVFHEGLKFWSCCTKRTTDFDTFLSQAGCTTGTHVWFKKKNVGEVKCRVDWHQTSTHVYVSIFGKKCEPDSSFIDISPVRLKVELSFPEQGGVFRKDMELAGVIKVEYSSVSMNPSKVEIKLKKAGIGSWSKLEIPREEPKPVTEHVPKNPEPEPQVESVDLNFI